MSTTNIDRELPLDVMSLRSDFPILASSIHGDKPLVYLDNSATTQRPRHVIQAVTEMYEKHFANVHRGIHWLSDQSTDRYEEAREKVRVWINAARSTEVIFTTGTTAGINLVARSWGDQFVQEGDEILLTEMEHHSNLVPWHQLAARSGCRIRHIPITEDGRLNLDDLSGLLTERTKLVALTAVSNVLGTVNPVREIAAAAHQCGAKILVDAAQSAPHDKTDVQDMDVDFLVLSGHKMLGPSGVGILYGRESILDAMPPFLGGGSMIRRVTLEGFEPADLPAKFEAGTPPIVPAIGLGAAIDYLEAIGLEHIHAYEAILTRHLHEVLNEVGDVQILGPDLPHKSGIVSFTVAGVHAHDVAQLLDREGVAIRAGHHCAMPLHKRLGVTASNRASVYFYNTLDELDVFGQALTAAKQVFRRQRRR